jgi:hypothetical protein
MVSVLQCANLAGISVRIICSRQEGIFLDPVKTRNGAPPNDGQLHVTTTPAVFTFAANVTAISISGHRLPQCCGARCHSRERS